MIPKIGDKVKITPDGWREIKNWVPFDSINNIDRRVVYTIINIKKHYSRIKFNIKDLSGKFVHFERTIPTSQFGVFMSGKVPVILFKPVNKMNNNSEVKNCLMCGSPVHLGFNLFHCSNIDCVNYDENFYDSSDYEGGEKPHEFVF